MYDVLLGVREVSKQVTLSQGGLFLVMWLAKVGKYHII